MKSVKVADYMATRLVTFKPSDPVLDAMDRLLEHSISGAPVVDDAGQLVGMLSSTDLLDVVIQDSYYDEPMGIVADYMATPVESIDADGDIYTVAERFLTSHRRRFPVVHEGRLVGQISRRDVLRAAMDFIERRSPAR